MAVAAPACAPPAGGPEGLPDNAGVPSGTSALPSRHRMPDQRTSSQRNALLLRVMETDLQAMRRADGWVAPCLHCRSTLAVGHDGEPRGATTLEHIVPRSWFRRRAAQPLVARVTAADDLRNLAVACARCNQQKGKSHDADGPTSERAREVVSALLETRLARIPPADRARLTEDLSRQ